MQFLKTLVFTHRFSQGTLCFSEGIETFFSRFNMKPRKTSKPLRKQYFGVETVSQCLKCFLNPNESVFLGVNRPFQGFIMYLETSEATRSNTLRIRWAALCSHVQELCTLSCSVPTWLLCAERVARCMSWSERMANLRIGLICSLYESCVK